MATAQTNLSEDQWIDELLKEAEQRLSAREPYSKSTSGVGRTKSLIKAPEPPELKQADGKAASKKQQELTVRTVQPTAQKDKKTDDDAGPNWFNLPRTRVTPELLRDLKLLRMRNVLNPKQFFRKDTRTALLPTFSQTGTIVEGPTEFFSARLTRRERKKTLAEEVLASTDAIAKFKTKYTEIQTRKMSGKKAHYKRLMAQRRKGR